MHGPATSARIGQPVPRKEDLRFVAGKGRYADDFNVEGQAYAWMVRSPHAHAVIRVDRCRGGASRSRRVCGAHRSRFHRRQDESNSQQDVLFASRRKCR